MSDISKVIRIIIVCAVLAACQPSNVPRVYLTKMSETENNPYGAWSAAELNQPHPESEKNILSGELIAIDEDSVFLLVEDHNLLGFPKSYARRIELITHKNQAGTYGTLTAAFLLPSIIGAIAYSSDPEYASGFLLIGIPVFITGVSITLIEAAGKKNMLIYPETHTLFDLQKFARFPSGLPEQLKRDELTMKKKSP